MANQAYLPPLVSIAMPPKIEPNSSAEGSIATFVLGLRTLPATGPLNVRSMLAKLP